MEVVYNTSFSTGENWLPVTEWFIGLYYNFITQIIQKSYGIKE